MELCITKMFSFSHHPAIKVSRVNMVVKVNPLSTKANPLTEPKPKMIVPKTRSRTYAERDHMKFRHFTKAQYKTNVNELVNSELYTRVSMISGDTIRNLKSSFTPQQMRAFLLVADPTRYQDGRYVMYDVVAPKKQNRGIDWSITDDNKFEIIDNDIIQY